MSMPLARVFAEKRAFIVPLALAAVLNALGYVVGVYPLTLRVAAQDERALTAQRGVVIARQQLDAAKKSASAKDRAAADLDTFYREVLPATQTGARRLTYLRLARLAEESRVRYERRSVDQRQPRDSELVELKTVMVLAGDYNQVRTFIHRLETSREFVVIRDVQLAQQEEASAPLSLTIELATFFRAPEHGS